MIANDVVEVIGELAEEMGDTEVGEILVRLGMAPDELDRMLMVALWSVERVERALDADGAEDAAGRKRIDAAAAWLDGFAIGLRVARRDASRSL